MKRAIPHRRQHAMHVVPGYRGPKPEEPRQMPRRVRGLPEIDETMTLEQILDILREE